MPHFQTIAQIIYFNTSNIRYQVELQMSITKAKINLKEGTIELEGSETFVDKYLEGFQQQIKNLIKSTNPVFTNQLPSVVMPVQLKDESEKAEKKKQTKVAQTVIPIPLDLKGKNGAPTLREFYIQKNPKSLAESLTVFAFYLKEYLTIEKMEAGHVSSCCKEVDIKVPTDIPSMFYDIKRHQGWLNVLEKRRFAEINTAGENFVKFDLPRKENATKDKATA
jgi:hypothetical protein